MNLLQKQGMSFFVFANLHIELQIPEKKCADSFNVMEFSEGSIFMNWNFVEGP